MGGPPPGDMEPGGMEGGGGFNEEPEGEMPPPGDD